MARCQAETNGGAQCENKAKDGSDFCGIGSHNADNAIDAYDDSNDETMTDDNHAHDSEELLPIKPQDAKDETVQEVVLALQSKTRDEVTQDGDTVADYVARTLAWNMVGKKENYSKAEGYAAFFGWCNVCDKRGAEGFDSDTCTKCEKEPDGDGEETMTVEIDGREVTGKKSDIMDLLE